MSFRGSANLFSLNGKGKSLTLFEDIPFACEHIHFISENRRKGGHVLDMSVGMPVKVQIDDTPYFNLYMPEEVSGSLSKF